MTEPYFFWLGIALCFSIAGLVKGVTGMGLPTVAMGLLGLVMPGAEAASLLILPSLLTNVWQMLTGPRLRLLWRRLWLMQVCVFLGTFATIGFLTNASSALGPVVLGSVLAVYAILGLSSFRFVVAPRLERWVSPAVGLLTGLLTGATGVFVVPAVPYLSSLIPEKEELIQSLGLSFTVSTVALAAALGLHGTFTSQLAGGSLLALVPAFAGMFLGQAIRNRLHPDIFRRWFFTSLLLIGLFMAARATWIALH